MIWRLLLLAFPLFLLLLFPKLSVLPMKWLT